MAYWTQQGGWQSYSLPTNAYTSYSGNDFAGWFPHKTPDAFASQYPYKSANDFTADYPSNRSTSRAIWFRLNKEGTAIDATSETEQTGDRWRVRTIGAGTTVKDALGDALYGKSNSNLNGNLKSIIDGYNANATANAAAPTQRQAAADAFNATQATNLTSLDTETLNGLVNSGLMSQEEANSYLQTAADTFEAFYDTNKITKFDPSGNPAYDPPAGGLAGFDPTIYAQTNEGQEDLARWQEAQNIATIGGRTYPDLDIVGTYGQNTWLQWNYAVARGKKTADGKWITASQTQRAKVAEDYKEEAVTDAQYQQYRDKVMGLGSFTSLKEWEAAQDPEFLRKWIASLSPEDAADRANGYLTIPTRTQIPEAIRTQAKMERGTTVLEGKLTSVLGAKEQEAADKFRSLTVDTFKETLKEYKKQRAKEQQFDFYSGMPGFDEIFNVNQELSNSLLGDTGVGGILSLTGKNQEKAEESLERQFSAVTGIPSKSNSVYN
jgi:hypothetical protein